MAVRISAWRGFLAGGLVAAVAYFLLPNTERVAALASTVFAYGSALAVAVGVRRHRPTSRGPWYLVGGALVAIGTGDALLLLSAEPDLADPCFLATYVALTVGCCDWFGPAAEAGTSRHCSTPWWSRSASGWCPGSS
jgi:hypothetical protein